LGNSVDILRVAWSHCALFISGSPSDPGKICIEKSSATKADSASMSLVFKQANMSRHSCLEEEEAMVDF
jgi:hypothetical protein